MKQLLFIITLLLVFTCQAQVKLATLPSPYSVHKDTMTCMSWFNMYHEISGDVTFIKFKQASVETMVHHYQVGLRYVKFSLYYKEDWNEQVIVKQYKYKVLKNLLVKT